MAADLEPVDIEINMRQNVGEEAGKVSQANEEMTRSVELMQEEIVRLNKVVADMSVALAEQRKITEANAGGFEGATRKIEEMQTALDKASKELDVYQEISNKMNEASREGADISDILNEARENLSDTEQTLIDNAHELIGNQEEINNTLEKSNKSVNANSTSNQLLSHAIGLVCENLGIENTQIKNAISNVKVIQAVKTGWANAVKVLNTQLGLTITQSKILLGVGLATGLGVIVAAVALLVSHFQDLQKEQEETARLNKIVTDSITAAAGEGEKAAKKETVALKLLYDASQKETNSKEDRIKAANELLRQYPKYFEHLSQEEILAGKGADAYNRLATSIIAAAKARAAQDKIVENETKKIELEEKRVQALADKEIAEKNKELAAYKYNPQNAGGNPYAANAMNMMRGKEVTDATSDMEKYNKTIWEATKEIGKYDEANRKLAEGINVNDLIKDKPVSSSGPKAPKNSASEKDKQKDQEEKANKDLAKKTAEYQKRIDAARIAAIQEGAERERAALKAEYDHTKAFIAQELKELGELELITGTPATGQRDQLKELDTAATAEYDSKIKALNDASQKVIREIFKEVNSEFSSELDNRLSEINRYYDDAVEVAKAAGAAINQINGINGSREKATLLANLEARKKELEFEREVSTRRMRLAKKSYLFESDQRRDELLALKKFGEQQLDILEEQYKAMPTTELANEIELARLELQEFNDELNAMPSRKLQEVMSGFKSLANSLSRLNGDIGDIFSGIADQLDNLSTAFDKEASTVDKISAGISGIVNLVNIVTSATAKRKATEKEFYRNSIALAHEYALALNEQLRLQSEVSGSGFMNDYSGRIKDGFAAMADASREYQNAIAKLSEGKAKISLRDAVDWAAVGKGAASGAAAGAAVGSIVPVIGTAIGAVAGAIIGGVVGLFGGKKKKNEYGSLTDIFPELVDGAGNLNRELAQTIINTDQVDDNTKQLIQNAIDWADAVEAANAQIKEIVVELAGELNNSMRDAIVGAWEAGEDASERMFQVAGDSLGKFVESLLYSAIFADVFKQFQDDLVASLNPATGDGDVLDDFERYAGAMDELDNDYIALLEAIKRRAAERGFDLWNDEEERKGTSAGLERISQDSANELNGNFYALRQQVGDIRNLQKEANALRKSMQAQLTRITDNTDFCRYLLDVKNSLEDMQTRGIKVKV
jgi:hypothetical protein